MKAVVCRGLGLAHARIEETAAPQLSPDGVRIAVRAAGVSFANLLVIEGRHQNRWEPPFIPGTEVAGIVLECGPKVALFRTGQRVVAGVRTGGFAQEVVAPEANVFALPMESTSTRQSTFQRFTPPRMARWSGGPTCKLVRRCWCTAPLEAVDSLL